MLNGRSILILALASVFSVGMSGCASRNKANLERQCGEDRDACFARVQAVDLFDFAGLDQCNRQRDQCVASIGFVAVPDEFGPSRCVDSVTRVALLDHGGKEGAAAAWRVQAAQRSDLEVLDCSAPERGTKVPRNP